jgi:hypothetical protein
MPGKNEGQYDWSEELRAQTRCNFSYQALTGEDKKWNIY